MPDADRPELSSTQRQERLRAELGDWAIGTRKMKSAGRSAARAVVSLTTGVITGYTLSIDALPVLTDYPSGLEVFLIVNLSQLSNGQISPHSLHAHLRRCGVSPQQVVLLLLQEGEPICISRNVADKINEWRQHGYRTGLHNAGISSPSLYFVSSVPLDYVNVAPMFIQSIHADRIKSVLVDTMLDLSRKLNCRVIADGIDNEQDLRVLLGLGVHFGQGSLLDGNGDDDRPVQVGKETQTSVVHLIEGLMDELGAAGIVRAVEDIVRPVKSVEPLVPVAEVVQYFNQCEDESGIVVVKNQTPVGLVMREKLFQRLAFKYGYSLYWNREISNLMDPSPLVLEAVTPLEVVSRMSMARNREQTYDLVIVTRSGQLAGVATIQDILNTITSTQIELARDANPLTGLPGNRRIEREIERRIHLGRPFTIIYSDLDHFKWFNDAYGFQKGDLVIDFTASLLREEAATYGRTDDFVGHIGGDDFIIITGETETDPLCGAIISRFDREIAQFYPEAANGETLEVRDRLGRKVHSKGIGISLSVLECRCSVPQEISLELVAERAGHLKKLAKDREGSGYVRGFLINQAQFSAGLTLSD